MSSSVKKNIMSAVLVLAQPALLFYALPWLMFLLVGGTVAQRYIGLYQSEKVFLGSFIFWLGPVPLPGAYTTLGVIALCLIVKLLLKSPWEKKQAGVIITHVSVIVLLVGGLVSALCREEGYILLGPDETGNMVSDYRLRELAILKNGKPFLAIPQDALYQDNHLTFAELPFSLRVDSYCVNCSVQPRAQPDTHLRAMAGKVDLLSAPLQQEDAENQSGVIFEVSGISDTQDGVYVASEALSQSPVILQGKDRYEAVLRHAQRELPFAVKLIHFDKFDYPGTEMARGYRSEVMVKDGALEWKLIIEMNQPLRHLGYTLYQSSFVENNGKLFTVLAVVKNTGALFPYIAIATLCVGLLLHLCIMFLPKVKS